MQTNLAEFIRNTDAGSEADAILRSCVHCGFCTAVCPTYRLLGDELDGPRGRIYLIKQFLEGRSTTRITQTHLDRCLGCRACETACPSGVRYGRLADIGRALIDQRVPRAPVARLLRAALRRILPYPERFAPLLRLAQTLRPLLPSALRGQIPPRARNTGSWPPPRHARHMLILDGCVQSTAAPGINTACARVLDRLGITVTQLAGCCGALSYHLATHEQARDLARRNIDAWWPRIQSGARTVISTASGCGIMVKEYGELLQHDPAYADRAAQLSALTRDISEVIADENLADLDLSHHGSATIAYQSPCTLQHGQRLGGTVETILATAGFELSPVPDAGQCCGSAGTYSILQKVLSTRLLEQKLAALGSGRPDCIATANIGCLLHLQSRATVPVRHWIELIDQALGSDVQVNSRQL